MPESYDLAAAVDPQRLADQARTHFPAAAESAHTHHGPAASIREEEYRGHTIRIQTTYEITIDGQPVGGHISVGNDGQVHYHPIPNQHFPSAVDMAKRVIDLTPPDYSPPDAEPDQPEPDPHHHHGA